MISNRNIDPTLDYQVLATYSGGSNKELNRTTAKSVEDAIEQTVRKVPGGEFLMNAKIYIVNGEYFAVEGDVWGSPTQPSFRGFKISDKVTWKSFGKRFTGVISALKDDISCLVRVDNEPDKTVELSYDKITKMGNEQIKEKVDSTSGSKGNQSFRGFKVGDKVTWNSLSNHFTGVISALKDEKSCLVRVDNEPGKTVELSYDRISKTDDDLIKEKDSSKLR